MRIDTQSRNKMSDNLFMGAIYLFLTILLLVVLYPLVYIISASFSSPTAVGAGRVWLWPVDFTLVAYKAVFSYSQIMTGFANSLFYMSVGTVINLILTLLAAYPLSRSEFRGRGFFTGVFVFTMYFSGGLVPTYLLICNLNLVNTRAVMIIPVALSVWNMIICRTFLQSTIPEDLFQAAKLDGCSEFRLLLKVVLPLSKPVLAVLGLYYGVAHWNSYFNAMLYLTDKRLFPLQLVLRSILIMGQIDYTMTDVFDIEYLMQRMGLSQLLKYAVIVVASVPVMLIYPFAQKYFIKGMMIGSLKG